MLASSHNIPTASERLLTRGVPTVLEPPGEVDPDINWKPTCVVSRREIQTSLLERVIA